MKKALIIGGGVSGCAAAHQLTLMGGWDITLVEQAPYLGAGVRTFWHGGHPHTMGPRHFLTQNEKVYEYLNKYCPLRSCAEHQFITYVPDDSAFYNFPIHVDDVERMPNPDKIKNEVEKAMRLVHWEPKNFEEFWINQVGEILYNKMINQYSKKMWQIASNRELDTFNWSPKGVAIKSGPRAAWDTAISAYPIAHDGYNSYFDIATEGVVIYQGYSRIDLETKTAVFGIQSIRHKFDIIISTISPDSLFNYSEGELPYIGRDFHKIVLPIEFAFPEDVFFVYDAGPEKFTRLTEFKKFTHHKSPHTLLGMEIPSENGKHYPVPMIHYQELAEQYFQAMPDGVFSMGRSGSYRYGLDIAGCIEQSFDLVEILKQGGSDHPVPGKKWRL